MLLDPWLVAALAAAATILMIIRYIQTKNFTALGMVFPYGLLSAVYFYIAAHPWMPMEISRLLVRTSVGILLIFRIVHSIIGIISTKRLKNGPSY
jgi:hypothetical protein